MSEAYKGVDPNVLAKQAEQDLASDGAKRGHEKGDTTAESGVDTAAASKFPGSEVKIGSAASGAGDNRDIPLSEGGSIDPVTGQPTKARDFEGKGGPEDKRQEYVENQGGNQDIGSNVRQGGDTSRPPNDTPNHAVGGTGHSTA
ncbi:hypothetical protein MBLNU230_g4061t1 [Neophaeotheca triangularis]